VEYSKNKHGILLNAIQDQVGKTPNTDEPKVQVVEGTRKQFRGSQDVVEPSVHGRTKSVAKPHRSFLVPADRVREVRDN